MSQFPLGYEQIPAATWVYVSSLLMMGLYFKFNRAWSVRNLDLILLVLLCPGLLLVHFGRLEKQTASLQQSESVEKVESPEDLLPISPSNRDALQPGDSDSQPSTRSNSSTGDASGTAVTEPPDSTTLPESRPPEQSSDQVPSDQVPEQSSSEIANGETANPAGSKGDLAASKGDRLERVGFLWLFCIAGVFLVRMLMDPMMVRRPLLEPNLSPGGLVFIGCSLFVFLMANIITSEPTADDLTGPQSAAQLIAGKTVDENDNHLSRHGPGYPLIHVLPGIVTTSLVANKELPLDQQQQLVYAATSKVMAILAHLAIVIGIVVIGYRHFENIRMGVGVAALYLMLPYTAQMTGRVDHVLPAALLVWAVMFYRRPLAAGMFLGLAIGGFYYPIFLLPLWVSFYWHRGLMRFVVGALFMLGATILSLVFTSSDASMFVFQLQRMFGIWLPIMKDLQGVWGPGGWYPVYRLPVLAAFIALSGTFVVWPAQKNLGTLLSCSAAVMIATQFWHGFGGGLYMAWYLPLTLLTFFRPNLEDRVALSVLGEGWFPLKRRRTQPSTIDQAA